MTRDNETALFEEPDAEALAKKLRNMLNEAYVAGYSAAMAKCERERLERNAKILAYAVRNKTCTIGMADSDGGTAHYKMKLVGYDCEPDFELADIS